MPAPVTFAPQTLNFGGVLPNSEGPDITVDPSLPADAMSFQGGVQIGNAPANANVTASIAGDTSHFQIRDVSVLERVLRDVDPNELPPGHHGPLPKERVLELVAQGDGSQPLPVKKGQFVLVRVKYLTRRSEGVFTGTLLIQGDTWETVPVPLSLFLAEVTTNIGTTLLTISQGQQINLPITVSSVVGPETDVRYELSTLQLHTGISLTPTTFHVERGESLSASLALQAIPDAPLGENTVFIRQSGFFRSPSLPLAINIIPAPIVDLRPLAERKIQEKYIQVGGRKSQLGLPIDPSLGVQHNGQEFFTAYRGGKIVFTSEGGASAFVTHQTFVVFKGIHCFGKSEAVDEPYAIVGVYALDAQDSTATKKFPIGRDSYEDFVASTDATEATIVSPNSPGWAPQSLVIVSTVMEQDSGNPDEATAKVEAAMDKVAAAAAVIGLPEVSAIIEILDKLGIPGLISDLFGTGDNLIGTQSLPIDSREVVPKRPMQKFGNIEFNFESPLLSDGDASYKLYYEVFVKEIPVPLVL